MLEQPRASSVKAGRLVLGASTAVLTALASAATAVLVATGSTGLAGAGQLPGVAPTPGARAVVVDRPVGLWSSTPRHRAQVVASVVLSRRPQPPAAVPRRVTRHPHAAGPHRQVVKAFVRARAHGRGHGPHRRSRTHRTGRGHRA